jgi:16S rRNA (adenine1518-N6/adenine1519-N6)-dimethyltransferase
MYQKEVAQKILPNDPRNAMGSLHALTLSQFELKHVVYAPPGAFVPPPKVDSQVLAFKRKENPDITLEDIDAFEKYLRLIFSQKRKQLGGILKNQWGLEETQKKLEIAQIDSKIRAEALSWAQVLKLFRA